MLADQAISFSSDPKVSLGLGSSTEHVGLSQHFSYRHIFLFVPKLCHGFPIKKAGFFLHQAKTPCFDVLAELGVVPWIGDDYRGFRLFTKRNSFKEKSAVIFENQVALESNTTRV